VGTTVKKGGLDTPRFGCSDILTNYAGTGIVEK